MGKYNGSLVLIYKFWEYLETIPSEFVDLNVSCFFPPKRQLDLLEPDKWAKYKTTKPDNVSTTDAVRRGGPQNLEISITRSLTTKHSGVHHCIPKWCCGLLEMSNIAVTHPFMCKIQQDYFSARSSVMCWVPGGELNNSCSRYFLGGEQLNTWANMQSQIVRARKEVNRVL